MFYANLNGFKISKIGMGGFNRFKDPNLTLKQAKELVEFAVKKGINFIDFGKEYDEKFIFESIKNVRKKFTS